MMGIEVLVNSEDSTEMSEAENLIQSAVSLGPLGGEYYTILE